MKVKRTIMKIKLMANMPKQEMQDLLTKKKTKKL